MRLGLVSVRRLRRRLRGGDGGDGERDGEGDGQVDGEQEFLGKCSQSMGGMSEFGSVRGSTSWS